MEKHKNYISQLQTLNNQDNSLDALLTLRGFACLMVVVCHCNPARNLIIYKDYDLSWIIFSHGSVAVWIFFGLSGYLMGKAFYTERYTPDVPGVISFWRNRILRIFPLYYFSILILALFVYPEVLKIENWGYLVRALTFTYDSSLLKGINPIIWTISTEMQFYVCVPFIYNFFKNKLFHRQKIILTFTSIIVIAFVLRLIVWVAFFTQLHENSLYAVKYWYTPFIMNLDLFLCGFLINPLINYRSHKDEIQDIIKNPEKDKKNLMLFRVLLKAIAIFIVVVLYLFTAYHVYHQELSGLPRTPGGIRTSTSFFVLQPVTALVTCFFVFVFDSDNYKEAKKNQRLSFESILRNPIRVLEVFGILSYGIYIWHQPIMLRISPIFTSSIPIEDFYVKLTATLILSTLLASVSYYLVELPAIKWKVYRKD